MKFGCSECGCVSKYQDQDALEHGYSILVCKNCGNKEFDD